MTHEHTSRLARSTRRRRAGRRSDRGAVSGLVAGGSAVVAVALVGGGIWAATQLGGGGAQPADVLPDSTLMYARVDLDPSASQKVDFVRLLRRFPDFEEQTGISSDKEDVRRTIAEAALEDADCDVDYVDDIEPWLGDRAAFAGVPGADGAEPDAVAVLQVTDASAAEDGLAKLAACVSTDGVSTGSDSSDSTGSDSTGSDSTGAFAFTGDYVVIAETQEIADAVVKGGESAPLSDDEQFTADMDRMGDPGLASFWVDVPAIVDAAKQSGADTDQLEMAGLDFSQVTSVYGTFRAGSDNIELALLSSGEQIVENGETTVGELPDTTLVALSVSGLGDAVPGQWERLRDTLEEIDPGTFDQQVAAFEQETGLALPEDAATLLGDNLTVALDSEGLDSDTFSMGFDPEAVNAGVRFSGDAEAIQDVITRAQAALEAQGAPLQMATEEVDGGVVLATNDDYAAQMTEGGLEDDDTFAGAVGDTGDNIGIFYVNLDQAASIARDFAEQSGEDDEFVGYLEPVRAFGVNVTAEDGYTQAIVRLTFDEE
jgi:hypothetical protein